MKKLSSNDVAKMAERCEQTEAPLTIRPDFFPADTDGVSLRNKLLQLRSQALHLKACVRSLAEQLSPVAGRGEDIPHTIVDRDDPHQLAHHVDVMDALLVETTHVVNDLRQRLEL